MPPCDTGCRIRAHNGSGRQSGREEEMPQMIEHIDAIAPERPRRAGFPGNAGREDEDRRRRILRLAARKSLGKQASRRAGVLGQEIRKFAGK
jgi:hypothetical protein